MSVHEAPAPNPVNRERRVTSRKDADFWPTPDWVTEALLARETPRGRVWEPACGDGAMARVIERAGHRVEATDLHDRGYGRGAVDFLMELGMPTGCQSIITNPPFNLGTRFLRHALQMEPHLLALFLPLTYLEGAERGGIFDQRPPSRVWVFRRRVQLWHSGVAQAGMSGGTKAFAWFVWQRHHPAAPVAWIA